MSDRVWLGGAHRKLDRDLDLVRLPLELTLARMEFRRDPGSLVIQDDHPIAFHQWPWFEELNELRCAVGVVNERGFRSHGACSGSLSNPAREGPRKPSRPVFNRKMYRHLWITLEWVAP